MTELGVFADSIPEVVSPLSKDYLTGRQSLASCVAASVGPPAGPAVASSALCAWERPRPLRRGP